MKEPPQDLPTPATPDAAQGESSDEKSLQSSERSAADGKDHGLVRLTDSEFVMGVDRQLLERFLVLIRDYYDKVDKATFFLEMRSGLINVSGIRNVRGILSHLVMFLDPTASAEQRAEQLKNAEGHFRRAIAEPYEAALDSLTVAFEELYERYKNEVLPAREEHAFLHSAPNPVMVDARLREIGDLGSKAREAKEKELSNPEWEVGIACFVDAFEKLFSLKSEIETYCTAFSGLQEEEARQENLRRQLRQDLVKEGKRSTLLHSLGILVGIVGILVAILLVVIPGFVESIRSFFQAIFRVK